MQFTHLVALARFRRFPFLARPPCVEMWQRLQSRFPKVLACVLMPDHLHLLIRAEDPDHARRRLSIELNGFTRSCFRGTDLWNPVAVPDTFTQPFRAQLMIRYIHLNPSRKALAHDPFEWEWSTHREATGAATPNWLDTEPLSGLWNSKLPQLPERVHAFVSNDPSVQVGGTPFPIQTPPGELVASLNLVTTAVLQATRAPEGATRSRTSIRRLAVLAADRMGAARRSKLADWIGATDRTVRNILAQPPSSDEERALAATNLILSNAAQFKLRAPQLPKTGN